MCCALVVMLRRSASLALLTFAITPKLANQFAVSFEFGAR